MCFQMAGKSKKVVREDPPPDPSWNPLGEEEEDSEEEEEEEELR